MPIAPLGRVARYFPLTDSDPDPKPDPEPPSPAGAGALPDPDALAAAASSRRDHGSGAYAAGRYAPQRAATLADLYGQD